MAQVSGDSIKVEAHNYRAGVASLYTVEFTLTDTLTADAVMRFVFPSGFDLSKATIAGSSSINGGFTVRTAGQNLYIARQGLGAIKYPGNRVDLKISAITNPPQPQTQLPITLQFLGPRQQIEKEQAGVITITARE